MTRKEYIDRRRELIPVAMELADQQAKNSKNKFRWDCLFLRNMDRLAYKTGLLGWNPDNIHRGYRIKGAS